MRMGPKIAPRTIPAIDPLVSAECCGDCWRVLVWVGRALVVDASSVSGLKAKVEADGFAELKEENVAFN